MLADFNLEAAEVDRQTTSYNYGMGMWCELFRTRMCVSVAQYYT